MIDWSSPLYFIWMAKKKRDSAQYKYLFTIVVTATAFRFVLLDVEFMTKKERERVGHSSFLRDQHFFHGLGGPQKARDRSDYPIGAGHGRIDRLGIHTRFRVRQPTFVVC
jgi:hypothetical protein